MTEAVKQVLQLPIQLADQVAKLAGEVQHASDRADCAELKGKAEKLAALLRQAARVDLYWRPTHRIMEDTLQVLEKAHALVLKCSGHGILKRVFTINPAAAFKRMSAHLDNSITDVSWLLRVSATRRNDDDDDDDEHLGMPPIVSNDPSLYIVWEQIAKLQNGSLEERAEAAGFLVSYARDNERNRKLIVGEEGIGPLLRLVKEGNVEGQVHAAEAIGLLGHDPESVEKMLNAGVCSVFAKVLKEGPMRAQAMVAWAVSELARNCPETCPDAFAQNNVIRLLVSHLAFETVEEHSKYAIPVKGHMSIHSVVLANAAAGNAGGRGGVGITNHHGNPNGAVDEDRNIQVRHPLRNHANHKDQMHAVIQSTMAKSAKVQHLSNGGSVHAGNGNIPKQTYYNTHQQHSSPGGPALKEREAEDPATKIFMKEMAAEALGQLARNNAGICKSITESKAILCFAVLLEKGPDKVQYKSAMALMEIARMAEKDAELRRSAFKPNSPAAKAVVDQMLGIIEKGEYSKLLLPCVIAIGCLSRTFRSTETRIIGPLVRLLDEGEENDVTREAVIALSKFACDENFLHAGHSRAIVSAGGTKHLVQLVYLAGQQDSQVNALVLLCYIARHVPDDAALAQAEVLSVLEWASRKPFVSQRQEVEEQLTKAKGQLELYQSRGSRGLFP